MPPRPAGEAMALIIGTGMDVVDIRRIEKTLARFGDRFVRRCFTEIERERSDRRMRRAESYAKRYAAKEAGAKALGTGLARGVAWRELGVVNMPGGRPTLVLTGGAVRRLAELVPRGHLPKIDLTLTDEYPYAQALVIISAVPDISAQDGSEL
ncbi:holo-ACP synthase [Tistrella sp. BH-R2-4]|uniref:Holo-[acyl-carrier-protein] synthase n=1 Tax=Tistrella arctica TaxID=3133430 RepID=A0ABU9YF56_9PROT